MRCQLLVLDIDSMKPVYSTSFDVKSVGEINANTSRSKQLKTAKDQVTYSFHNKANEQFKSEISKLFDKAQMNRTFVNRTNL